MINFDKMDIAYRYVPYSSEYYDAEEDNEIYIDFKKMYTYLSSSAVLGVALSIIINEKYSIMSIYNEIPNRDDYICNTIVMDENCRTLYEDSYTIKKPEEQDDVNKYAEVFHQTSSFYIDNIFNDISDIEKIKTIAVNCAKCMSLQIIIGGED